MKRLFCCGTRQQKKKINLTTLAKQKHLPQNRTWSLKETQDALSTSSFKILSNEVILQIFRSFSVQELANVSLVCRSFKIFADHDDVWKPKCNMSKKLYSKSYKQIYMECIHAKTAVLDMKFQLLDDYCLHTKSGDIIRPDPFPPQLSKIDDSTWKYRTNLNSTQANALKSIERFSQHPNSTPWMTIKFLVNINRTAHEFLLLMEKASRSRDHWQETGILKQMIKRYYQFLQLKISQPTNLFLIPTIDIEIVWQTHLLRPELYRTDCLRLFNQVIDHSLILSRTEQFFKEQAFLDTCHLYEQQFDQKYCSLRSLKKKNKFSFQPIDEQNLLSHGQTITYSYWDRTYFEFSSKPPTDYENPFSFTEDDIIQDGKWFDSSKQFIANIFNRVPISEIPIIDLTHETLDQFQKSYEKLLYIIAKYSLSDKNESIPSTYPIDIIWYSHMQEPLNYAADCIRLVGSMICHPSEPIIEDQTLQESRQKVHQIWKDEFQCDMNIDYLYNET